MEKATEISKVADVLKRFKRPELSEIGRMTEICTISGYYCLEEVMDTSAADREPSYKSLADKRPACARTFRKILDSKAPPVETKAKPASFKEVDIYSTLKGIDTPSGIGDIRRQRQEAIDTFSAALPEGDKAEPPHKAFLGPKLEEAPWTPEDAAHKRTADPGRVRRKRDALP